MSGGILIKLSVLDRIILHLHSYRPYESSKIVPEGVTQVGIASGININPSHVPRAVKTLLSQKLIIEETVHVTEHPSGRRRRAYFLTDYGVEVAFELLSNLASLNVEFTDENGESSKISLIDLKKKLNTEQELYSLYKFITPELLFDYSSWQSAHERIQTTDNIQTSVQKTLPGLNLTEIKQILGPEFDTEEIDAIYYYTDGDPQVIKTIAKIDKTEIADLKGLPTEERALTLCVLARKRLEKHQ
jgi:DNA-binding MarR family transcriptional regulator